MFEILVFIIKVLVIIIPVLISVAYFTLAERKVLGAIQRRRGPNVVGVFGLLQPLSDGFKLLIKETVIPSVSNPLLFVVSPMITFVLSLLSWCVIPYSKFSIYSELSVGYLYLLAVSSLGVYGIILSGWSSNSKYSFLGALRSAAQMVSYEVSIGFIVCTVVLCSGSFNLQTIVESQRHVWYVIPYSLLSIMFFISALAETNRHPFDLPEAEAELVSGYNVEYSAMGFALFSLGEYSNMLIMSSAVVILFLGGWTSPFYFLSGFGGFWFSLKICFLVVLFIWMRAALPRYRYDQLMSLGWKVYLPISLVFFFLTAMLMLCFNFFPS